MEKNFSISIKALALFLAILTIAYLLPMTVFGEMIAENGSENVVSEETEESTETAFTPEQLINENYFAPEEEKPADALCEDTSKRESNVKQFLMSDGSYTMAVYAQNVHYKDEAGEWQDIDNTLTDSGSEFSNANARVKFSKKIPGNEGIFTLHEHNRKITVSLEGAIKKTVGKVTNRVTDHGENATELQKMTTLDKLNASVFYADILENTDLEYVLNGSDIKENIIIKAKGEEYVYVFTLSLNNLTAELVGNEVLLRDGEEHIYTIPAPYMLDASGARSDSVTYTLTDGGNGKYTLTVTADAEWINSEERAFPVTVDPAITVTETMDVEIETATVSYDPDQSDSSTKYGKMEDVFRAGHIDFNYRCNGYIKVSGLSRLLRPSYVYNANLNLMQSEFIYCYPGAEAPSGTYLNLFLIQCSSWSYDALSWNNQPTEYYNSIYSFAVEPWNTDYDPIPCNITNSVSNAIRYGNDSIYFRLQSAQHYNGLGESCCSSFYTSGTWEAPCVTITYRNNTGLEDYWSTTSHSAGFAGSGAVNNKTGELTFVIDTLSSTDSILPMGVQLVYNGVYAGEYVTSENSALPYNDKLAGKGFILNLQQSISKQYVQDTVCYILTDADGTEHWFMPTAEQYIYTDVDGLGLTLDAEALDYYTVSDKQGTVYTYSMHTNTDYKAFLTQIKDEVGNELNIIPDSDYSGFRPKTLSVKPKNSTEIIQLKLFYNSAGLIKRVYNPHTGEAYVFLYSATYNGTAFSQDNSGYLRYVIYACGLKNDGGEISYATETEWDSVTYNNFPSSIDDLAIASYTYDYYGLLTSVKDELQNREIRYTYDWENRVSNIQEYAGSNAGQKIGFTYNTHSTDVISSGTDDVYNTSDDLETTYIFDEKGRTNICYTSDKNGTETYSYNTFEYKDQGIGANNVTKTLSSLGSYSNYLINSSLEAGTSSTVSGWSKIEYPIRYAEKSNSGTYSEQLFVGDGIKQTVTLSAGTYTFSIYALSLLNGNYDKLQLSAQKNGTILTTEVFTLYNSEDVFSTYHITFENTTAGTITLAVEYVDTDGNLETTYILIDDAMLAKSNAAQEYSMLEGGHFEKNVSSYWGSNAITATTDGIDGCYLKLGGECQSVSYTVFEREYSDLQTNTRAYLGEIPDTFSISALARASSALTGDFDFHIKITAEYATYTGAEYSETKYLNFYPGITKWLMNSTTITENIYIGKIKELTLTLVYTSEYNFAYYDNIVVIENSKFFSEYRYNSLGNVEFARNDNVGYYYYYDTIGHMLAQITTAGNGEIHRYDNNKLACSVYFSIDGKYYGYQGKYEIEDDENSQFIIQEITVIDGVTHIGNIIGNSPLYLKSWTEYAYTDHNQLKTHKIYDLSHPRTTGIQVGLIRIGYADKAAYEENQLVRYEPYSKSSSDSNHITYLATYVDTAGSPIFGAIKTEETDLGKTEYFYDETNGRLLATLSSKGEGLAYSYDVLGNVVAVYPATVSGDAYTALENGSVEYEYNTLNQLETITTASTEYTFIYDAFGNSSEIKMGSDTLASYTYNAGNGKLNTLTYGNGAQVKYIYDALDRVKQIQYNNNDGNGFVTAYEYEYDEYGNLVSIYDAIKQQTIINKFDIYGKLLGSETLNGNVSVSKFSVNYDNQNRVRNTVFELNALHNVSGHIQTTQEYFYNIDYGYSNITTTYGNFSATTVPDYDVFGRETSRDTVIRINRIAKFSLSEEYTYTPNSDGVIPTLPTSFKSTVASTSNTYRFSYDGNGNITEIRNASNVLQYKYTYDAKGQLIREDNQPKVRTILYSYDYAGNILSKDEYIYQPDNAVGELHSLQSSVSYTYGADGRLSEFDGDIDYDNVGNPTTYRGNVLAWKNGRQLASYGAYSYTYNSDGLRTSKSNNGVLTNEYILNGSQVMRQLIYANGVTYVADYIYHENGSPLAFAYYQQGSAPVYYFYETNIQGDIVNVYNENGVCVLGYRYDAYGVISSYIYNASVCTNTFLQAVLFAYRGYIYDSETALYYLQSRYYAPDICRFLNADSVSYLGANGDLLGYNLYAYCSNNPVMLADDSGFAWETIWDIISLGSSVVDVATRPYDPLAWIGLAGDAADLLLPFIGGIGETARAFKAASRASDALDTASDVKKGWKVGEDITSLTKAGNKPSWSTLKSRYWKNKAHYFKNDYSEVNIKRMQRGLPPQFSDGAGVYSMELHHIRRRTGENFYFFMEVTPLEHSIIDPFRFVKRSV